MTDMPNFLFDATLTASLRIDAADIAEARRILEAALDCAEVNAGALPDGSPLIFEASLRIGPDGLPDLVIAEVDGEPTLNVTVAHFVFGVDDGFDPNADEAAEVRARLPD